MVRLHEHPDREPTVVVIQFAGCRADAALELMASHAGPAADIALRHRKTGAIAVSSKRIEHGKDVFRRDVVAIDVVENPVPGFGHNWRADP
jgi:hypothetical protein